jgi:hypothetical protein
MCRILKAFTIALACAALVAGGAVADGSDFDPPDTNGDPIDPHGGTLTAPDEAVLLDVSRALIALSWMVPWVIR